MAEMNHSIAAKQGHRYKNLSRMESLFSHYLRFVIGRGRTTPTGGLGVSQAQFEALRWLCPEITPREPERGDYQLRQEEVEHVFPVVSAWIKANEPICRT